MILTPPFLNGKSSVVFFVSSNVKKENTVKKEHTGYG